MEHPTITAIKQNSYRKMIELQMKGDHIDNYVTRFKHLAKEAGFPLNQAGTIEIFIKKILKDLLTRMIERDNNFNPETATFDEWVAQAQDVIKKTIRKTDILSTAWPTSWQRGSAFKQYKHTPKPQYSSYQHNHSSRNDDVVPMDVDVVRGATTEQEKELYHHKGLCFECQGSGHMARYCPKKKQKQRQQQSQGFKLKMYNKPYKSFDNCKPMQHFGQKKYFNKPRTPFARIAQFLNLEEISRI